MANASGCSLHQSKPKLIGFASMLPIELGHCTKELEAPTARGRAKGWLEWLQHPCRVGVQLYTPVKPPCI